MIDRVSRSARSRRASVVLGLLPRAFWSVAADPVLLLLAAVVAGLAATPLSARAASTPVALVTAEPENELIAVDLSSARILRRVRLPSDPEYVGVERATVVVVSGRAGAVSLLAWPS